MSLIWSTKLSAKTATRSHYETICKIKCLTYFRSITIWVIKHLVLFSPITLQSVFEFYKRTCDFTQTDFKCRTHSCSYSHSFVNFRLKYSVLFFIVVMTKIVTNAFYLKLEHENKHKAYIIISASFHCSFKIIL